MEGIESLEENKDEEKKPFTFAPEGENAPDVAGLSERKKRKILGSYAARRALEPMRMRAEMTSPGQLADAVYVDEKGVIRPNPQVRERLEKMARLREDAAAQSAGIAPLPRQGGETPRKPVIEDAAFSRIPLKAPIILGEKSALPREGERPDEALPELDASLMRRLSEDIIKNPFPSEGIRSASRTLVEKKFGMPVPHVGFFPSGSGMTEEQMAAFEAEKGPLSLSPEQREFLRFRGEPLTAEQDSALLSDGKAEVTQSQREILASQAFIAGEIDAYEKVFAFAQAAEGAARRKAGQHDPGESGQGSSAVA